MTIYSSTQLCYVVVNHSKEKQDEEFESVLLSLEGLPQCYAVSLTQNMSIVNVAAKNCLHRSWENEGRFNLGK